VRAPPRGIGQNQVLWWAFEFHPQSCTNTAWSIARMQMVDHMPLWNAISASALRILSAFNNQDLTNTAWSLATLRFLDAPLLDSLSSASLPRISEMQPQDWGNTAWAYAKLGFCHEPLLSAIAAAARRRITAGDPQNWANMAWAWAALKCHDQPLLQSISAQSIADIRSFGMQELANTVWSVSQLKFEDVALLRSLCRKAMVSLRTGSVQNLTNTAWAFAQIRFKNQTLFNSIAAEVISLISEFREQDLSITAWSFARREVRDEKLMSAIACAAIRTLQGSGRPQGIANLSWSMALLDLRHKELLEALAAAALRLSVEQFTPQELTNTLWSFAALKCNHAPLMDALSAQSIAHMGQVTTQNLVNTAWALDVLEWPALDSQTLLKVLRQFSSTCSGSLGVEWVTLATLAKERNVMDEAPAFMAEFHARVLGPALAGLTAIREAPDDHALADRMKRFQDWVLEMQTPHFGAAFTPDALVAAGCGPLNSGGLDRGWVLQAQEAVLRVSWWSCPHAAVSSHGVAAWVAANLQIGATHLDEPGRVYFADDSSQLSILVERMLQPIFLQAPRGGHAERRALIDLLRSVARSFKSGNSESWAEVTGDVQLYASHYPCISCLATIAQFTRRLPCITMQVEFDNAWSSWTERVAPSASPEMLIMGMAV